MQLQQTPDVDYQIFKRRILSRIGLTLDDYKQAQMERRLRYLMEQAGAANFIQYYKMIDADPALLQKFQDFVTIKVSELFRNPEQFAILEQKVIPDLLTRCSSIRVWSAGCSYGQEAYSLAISLAESAPNRKHSILATDIDNRALDNAKIGVFSDCDIKNLGHERKSKWFTDQGSGVAASSQIRSMIRFQKLNLLGDPFPNGMDLIVCRNVVIYFTDDAKDKLYRRLYHSLKPGGYLFVGGTERIRDYKDIGYFAKHSLYYQRPLDS